MIVSNFALFYSHTQARAKLPKKRRRVQPVEAVRPKTGALQAALRNCPGGARANTPAGARANIPGTRANTLLVNGLTPMGHELTPCW